MNLRTCFLTALLSATLGLCVGCIHSKPVDISSLAPYSKMIGAKYVLQQDCYVYEFEDRRRRVYVGNGGVLPPRVSQEFVGRRADGYIISGLIRGGATFAVVGAEEEFHSIETGIVRHWQVRFDEPFSKYGVVYATDLTDITKNPPVFLDSLAKPLK